jgi:hypothetical protein
MGQLHEFSIVQTNVKVQEKCQKKYEEGNCGAHSYWKSWRVHHRDHRCHVLFMRNSMAQLFKRSCPSATKFTYIDTPNDPQNTL